VHHIGSPPVIGIRSVGITAATLAAVGNPNHPAYFPDYYLPYTSHMTFFERVHNTALYVWNKYTGTAALQQSYVTLFLPTAHPNLTMAPLRHTTKFCLMEKVTKQYVTAKMRILFVNP
jgi:hypothetical protein